MKRIKPTNFLAYLIYTSLFLTSIACSNEQKAAVEADKQPPVIATFEKLDTIATNDWWNRQLNPIIDVKVPREEVVAFGMYTVANNTLKMTAQLFPLYPNETRTVRLEIKEGNDWKEVQQLSLIHI